MGTTYADKPYQPGEKPRFELKFTPGKVIAHGDSLTGDPTATVYRLPEKTDVTNDVVGQPAITGVLIGTPSRIGNSVFFQIGNMVDGTDYDVEIGYATTNGELGMKEDFIVECRESP